MNRAPLNGATLGSGAGAGPNRVFGAAHQVFAMLGHVRAHVLRRARGEASLALVGSVRALRITHVRLAQAMRLRGEVALSSLRHVYAQARERFLLATQARVRVRRAVSITGAFALTSAIRARRMVHVQGSSTMQLVGTLRPRMLVRTYASAQQDFRLTSSIVAYDISLSEPPADRVVFVPAMDRVMHVGWSDNLVEVPGAGMLPEQP